MFIALTPPGQHPQQVYVAVSHIIGFQRSGKFTEVRCIASGGSNATVFLVVVETPEQILNEIHSSSC